jgi:hypothetical protein
MPSARTAVSAAQSVLMYAGELLVPSDMYPTAPTVRIGSCVVDAYFGCEQPAELTQVSTRPSMVVRVPMS